MILTKKKKICLKNVGLKKFLSKKLLVGIKSSKILVKSTVQVRAALGPVQPQLVNLFLRSMLSFLSLLIEQKTGELKIEDLSEPAVMVFIEYLYTGSVPEDVKKDEECF